MKKVFFIVPLLSWLLIGCNVKERNELKAKVDSLKIELNTAQEAAYTLQEVGVMIDSIDANRKLLRSNMVEGAPYEDYVSRMKDINDHVKTSQAKLRELEESLRKSNSTSSAYASSIRKLKRDLEKTSRELVELQALVDKYKNENDNLAHTVALQDSSLVEKEAKIKIQIAELDDLETRVNDLMVQSTMNEADAYFTKAQAFEEMARRTHFAPRKKKETRKEALELYRMALNLGKVEAADKIMELESKI
jgi:chromosome segregation ATPase